MLALMHTQVSVTPLLWGSSASPVSTLRALELDKDWLLDILSRRRSSYLLSHNIYSPRTGASLYIGATIDVPQYCLAIKPESGTRLEHILR